MVHLHLSPFVSVVRAYTQPDGYALRSPYTAVVTVTHVTATEVHLSAAMGVAGAVDAEMWTALLALLKDQGVKLVSYERHGKKKTTTL